MDLPPPSIVAPAVPAPPIIDHGGPGTRPSKSTAMIVMYAAANASCGGAEIPFAMQETPLPSGTTRYDPSSPGSVSALPPREPPDVVLSFHIDGTGRAVGIKREPAPTDRLTLYADSSDLEPALAVSRFAVGRPRIDCRAIYRASTIPIANASPAQLSRFLASDVAGSRSPAAASRLRPAGTTCASPAALRPLVLAYPDAKKIEVRPGAVVFSTIAFDVDPSGKPIDLRVLASNDAAHGAEVARAVGASRFASGPVKGCIMGSAQRGQVSTEPPPRPSIDAFRRAQDTCAQVKPTMQFAIKPSFPLAFRKRAVEGWAIVRYDVAPWGEPGNIEVVAAEPAAIFGEVAKQVVRSGKAEASGTGASGCLAPVSFKLADDDGRGEIEPGEMIR